MRARKAVVVGAGIGGLAAALALLRRGWQVEALERAPALREVGAGLQISPNGFRVLDALGLGAAVEAGAFEPEEIEMRYGRSGRLIFRLPAGATMRARFGAPYLQVHRADLIETLRAAVEAAGGVIRTGVEVTGYDAGASGAAAVAASGPAAECDLLVGADGLRSAIRARMLGPEAPRFTGAVAYRAVAPAAALGDLRLTRGACLWVGPGAHAVTYPLRRGAAVNFVGVVDRDEPGEESWTAAARRDEVAAAFAGWAPPVARIVAEAADWRRWPLYDRAPLVRWSDGRVALLGDAAHPMLPSFAQGACQALEDAWRLAARLEESDDVAAALIDFEAARKPRASAIQKGAAENMARFHRRDWLTKTLGFLPIWLAGRIAPQVIDARSAWIYAHDETAA